MTKIQTFSLSQFISKNYFGDHGSQNYSNKFLGIFKVLVALFIKLLDRNLKGYQKKVWQLLILQKLLIF